MPVWMEFCMCSFHTVELDTTTQARHDSPFAIHELCKTFFAFLTLIPVIMIILRKWPFSCGDERCKTSPRAFVFARCDIQSERR